MVNTLKNIAIGTTILAIVTMWPATASKLNRLGYMSLCSFAPWSTVGIVVVGLVLAGVVALIRCLAASSR